MGERTWARLSPLRRAANERRSLPPLLYSRRAQSTGAAAWCIGSSRSLCLHDRVSGRPHHGIDGEVGHGCAGRARDADPRSVRRPHGRGCRPEQSESGCADRGRQMGDAGVVADGQRRAPARVAASEGNEGRSIGSTPDGGPRLRSTKASSVSRRNARISASKTFPRGSSMARIRSAAFRAC